MNEFMETAVFNGVAEWISLTIMVRIHWATSSSSCFHLDFSPKDLWTRGDYKYSHADSAKFTFENWTSFDFWSPNRKNLFRPGSPKFQTVPFCFICSLLIWSKVPAERNGLHYEPSLTLPSVCLRRSISGLIKGRLKFPILIRLEPFRLHTSDWLFFSLTFPQISISQS